MFEPSTVFSHSTWWSLVQFHVKMGDITACISAMVLAGIALIFFVEVGMRLCLGFLMKIVIIIHQCFSCCWAELHRAKNLFLLLPWQWGAEGTQRAGKRSGRSGDPGWPERYPVLSSKSWGKEGGYLEWLTFVLQLLPVMSTSDERVRVCKSSTFAKYFIEAYLVMMTPTGMLMNYSYTCSLDCLSRCMKAWGKSGCSSAATAQLVYFGLTSKPQLAKVQQKGPIPIFLVCSRSPWHRWCHFRTWQQFIVKVWGLRWTNDNSNVSCCTCCK